MEKVGLVAPIVIVSTLYSPDVFHNLAVRNLIRILDSRETMVSVAFDGSFYLLPLCKKVFLVKSHSTTV